ncbi:MAG: ATP-binding protein [Limisphaerales bacterium]
MKWLALLLRAPGVAPEQQADRIRFMERDVCLTIKVIVLGSLAFVFLSQWLEGVSTVGELGIETVRGAFRVYLVANIIIGMMLLAMDYLPIAVVQWAVFVLNIVDGTFVALLIVITGGLESTIYWIFLVLVIRNSVSITRVRLQIAVNLFIVLCYLFAGILDLAMQELRAAQEQVDTHLSQVVPVPTHPLLAKLPPSSTASAPGAARKPVNRFASSGDESTDLGRALVLAASGLSDGRSAQALSIRVLLLLLLAICCYGINVLADLQLQAQAEAQEFAIRQEQLRSTGRLAAEIAHQLKNPLAIINNAAFSLQRHLKDGKPAVLQQVEMIREEVARSDSILTELMGYAQLSEGRVERLSVREEIERALHRVFPTALQHEVQVQSRCPDGLPPLLMQRSHLGEALVNLLANARDATNSKGRIEIAASLDEGGAVAISIADNGPGIPEHQLEHIFDPYYSTKEKGTGLGLAIVRHNTEIYGGKVAVESTLGSGTKFTLRFPAKSTMTTAT